MLQCSLFRGRHAIHVDLADILFFWPVIQVLSRLWAVWGIVLQAEAQTSTGSVDLLKLPNVTLSLSMSTLIFAWSVTEVLRYGFFAVKVPNSSSL